MDSILNSIKILLGITVEDLHFDQAIIVYINSAFYKLNRVNVGPKSGFRIDGPSQTWDDYKKASDNMDVEYIDEVTNYVFLRTKLEFDPPSSAVVLENYRNELRESEWRLNEFADYNT